MIAVIITRWDIFWFHCEYKVFNTHARRKIVYW